MRLIRHVLVKSGYLDAREKKVKRREGERSGEKVGEKEGDKEEEKRERTYSILSFEYLRSYHVPHAVPDEREGRRKRPLGPAGDVGWNQCPG